jgi:hypothetical protein
METPSNELVHHTRNLSAVLEGILLRDEPVKEKAKRIEHRCREFLQCLEGLRIELEVRESDRDQGP